MCPYHAFHFYTCTHTYIENQAMKPCNECVICVCVCVHAGLWQTSKQVVVIITSRNIIIIIITNTHIKPLPYSTTSLFNHIASTSVCGDYFACLLLSSLSTSLNSFVSINIINFYSLFLSLSNRLKRPPHYSHHHRFYLSR